jgi:putative membrane protein
MTRITRSHQSRGNTFSRLHDLARVALLFGAALAIALVTACSSDDDAEEVDTTQGTARTSGVGATRAASPAGDASILASLDAANVSDSATGAIAAAKATSSDLRAFAAQMMRDHHAMRLEGERVASRLRLTPAQPGDTSGARSGLAATLSLLNATPRGADFDKAYIDNEVEFHLAFLETVTGAMERAGETEVKAFIQKLAPMLLEHLDRARELQGRLR